MSDLQRTEAWIQSRLGKVTASRIADVVAKTRNGWGAGRANYMAELVAERLTGVTASRFINGAMQWGIDTEADAIDAYEFFSDQSVEAVGSVDHPKIAMTSASPDGLVGSAGLIEVKCPNTSSHIDTLLGASIPNKYLLQMQWQMACTERQWCDFVSFDPRLPESMKIYITRIERDDKKIDELETHVARFLAELDNTITRLQATYEAEAA